MALHTQHVQQKRPMRSLRVMLILRAAFLCWMKWLLWVTWNPQAKGLRGAEMVKVILVTSSSFWLHLWVCVFFIDPQRRTLEMTNCSRPVPLKCPMPYYVPSFAHQFGFGLISMISVGTLFSFTFKTLENPHNTFNLYTNIAGKSIMHMNLLCRFNSNASMFGIHAQTLYFFKHKLQ